MNNKINKFSIRKTAIGAFSVLIGSLLMGAPVYAQWVPGNSSVVSEEYDSGDAPASYGEVKHRITENGPYLGLQGPDGYGGNEYGPWVHDDYDSDADEGLAGTQNDLLTDFKILDLSEPQLNIKLNPGQIDYSSPTGGEIYVNAWIDFDGDGTFSETEGILGGPMPVGGSDTILRWSQAPEHRDPNFTGKYGVRIRISSDRNSIMAPTGEAPDGEVEDFSIGGAKPPQGEFHSSFGPKNQEQNSGDLRWIVAQDNFDNPQIIRSIKIVDPSNGALVDTLETTEGTYTANFRANRVTFMPKSDFVGKATGVSIRAIDSYDFTTDWQGSSRPNGNNSDGFYQPEVRVATYSVNYEFGKADGVTKDLPQEILNRKPASTSNHNTGDNVVANENFDTTYDDVENDGAWVFEGFDKDSVTITNKNETFVGKWNFRAKTYQVTHEFQSITPNKTLPSNITDMTPETVEMKVTGEEVQPGEFRSREVDDVDNDGVWRFVEWDKTTATINKADEHFIGKWAFIPNSYKVVHEFVKHPSVDLDLPQAILGFLPPDQLNKENGANVTPTEPTTKEYVDQNNDGVWRFMSYTSENGVIAREDLHFIGEWSFTPNQYEVIHDFTSGSLGEDLPEEVERLTPVNQTGKRNNESVTPTEPERTEVPVEGGTWTFGGWNNPSDTVNKGNVKFTGTWTFVANKYIATHNFITTGTDKQLPQELLNRTPSNTEELSQGQVVEPKEFDSTTYVDEENDGKWEWRGWNKDNDTVNNSNLEFTGRWTFIPNTYNAVFRFMKAPDTMEELEIPEEISTRTPAERTNLLNGTEVTVPEFDRTPVEDSTNDGRWEFRDWEKESEIINKNSIMIDGFWRFIPNTYNLNYVFEKYAGTPENLVLPQEILAKLPEAMNNLENGRQVDSPNVDPMPIYDEKNDGNWGFVEWDNNSTTINKANATVTGFWRFVPLAYYVEHEFVSEDGSNLPPEVISNRPDNIVGIRYKDNVSPKEPLEGSIRTNSGTWSFLGYDQDSLTVGKMNGKFTGTWRFTPNPVVAPKFNVAYIFTSSSDRELPEEIKNRTPITIEELENGSTVDSPNIPTEYETEEGIWLFNGWDNRTVTINNSNEVVSGGWTFYPYSTEFLDLDSKTSIKDRESKRTPKLDIGGYEYVRTDVDNSGKTIHYYSKVKTAVEEVVEKAPNDYPTVDLPIAEIGTTPDEAPTVDLPVAEAPAEDASRKDVPNTSDPVAGYGLASSLSAVLGLLSRKRKSKRS